MKHATIPVFVPHYACRHRCVFCDQIQISGTSKPYEDPTDFLQKAVDELPVCFDEADIAFFGGTFTGLSRTDMARFLTPALRLKQTNPRITGIRLSTRPDTVDDDTLAFLKSYGVTTVELGAQSMDDNVLLLSGRGHTAADTVRASEAVKKVGLGLVLQFMPGLPGDTDDTIRATADKILSLSPDAVRIYPCVIIKDTPLETMYRNGTFTPLTVSHAVDLCADMAERFDAAHIQMIRVGLHSSDLVKNDSVVAGPFHPAFGELVTQKRYYNRAFSLLSSVCPTFPATLCVARGETSKLVGNKRENILKLEQQFNVLLSVQEDDTLQKLTVKVVSP